MKRLFLVVAAIALLSLGGIAQADIQVTINPSDAVADGAQWRVGTGPWLSSGETYPGVADGTYIVSCKNIIGWITPPNQLVTITAGQMSELEGTYETPGSVVAWGGVNGYGQCGLPVPNDDFVSVAAGNLFSLGLKADGSIVAWGNIDPRYGVCNVPEPNTGFVSVSADGSIVAWGSNDLGQGDVSEPNTGFVAVSAGGYHCLGLRADGHIVAWGLNHLGQCTVPGQNADFVAVAAGEFHSLGLKADGSIVRWGYTGPLPEDNTDFVAVAAGIYTSLGLKANGSIISWEGVGGYEFVVPAPNTDFIAEAAGSGYGLGLEADGSIVAWGYTNPPPEPNTGFVAVAAGGGQNLGLKTDGSVVAWGANNLGQCNVPEPNTGFLMVAAGRYHSLGIQHAPPALPPVVGSLLVTINPSDAVTAGAQWRVGTGDWHSSDDTDSSVAVGDHVVSFKNIIGWITPPNQLVTITAGETSQVAGTYETPGSVVAWGGVNGYGQCGLPVPNADFVSVSAGTLYSLGLKADGSIVEWGNNYNGYNYGQGDVPTPNTGFVAVLNDRVAWGSNDLGQGAVSEPNTGFVAVSAGTYHSLGLKADGRIVAWGLNHLGQCTVPEPNEDFVAVAAGSGYYYSLGLKADGRIVAWGASGYGQCNVPVLSTGFVAVAAGWGYCLGLTADGSVATWGSSGWGENVGLVAPNTGFTMASAGNVHGLGLKADGSMVGWGRDFSSGSGWVEVPDPNTGFIAVAAGGGGQSLGLKADGSIVAWGANNYGQCNVPEPNTGFLMVAAGAYHSLGIQHAPPALPPAEGSLQVTLNPAAAAAGAQWRVGTNPWHSSGYTDSVAEGVHVVSFRNMIGWITPPNQLVTITAGQTAEATGAYREPGSIVAWGDNTYGQCDVPAPNTGFVAVAAGMYHSLGLKADGSIVAWGYDPWGKLLTVPEPNTGFVAVAAGMYHSLGLKADGSIVAWGLNKGNNVYSECDVPTPNTGFVAVSAAWNNSLGLKADGSIVAWGNNWYGQCNVPVLRVGFVAASCGGPTSLGLTVDGSVVSWGSTGGYEFLVPAPNTGLTTVATGGLFGLSLRADGSIWAWGYIVYWPEFAVPLPNTDFIAVATDGGHILGLKADGSIVAWGLNNYGQCDVPAPNTGFLAVAAGYNYSLGLQATAPTDIDQTINFGPVADKTFGDADFTVSATATSNLPVTFTASGDCTVTPDGTVHITGAGSGIITAHQAGDANYNAAPDVPQTVTINKASLTITADNKAKLYKAVNPPFTVTYSGFVNGETETTLSGTLLFSTTAIEASWVGSYPITPSGLTSNNYDITYVDGILTIAFKGNSGILQPVNQDNSSVFKQGSTIPLKFRVYDNNNMSVGPPPNVVSSFSLNVWSSGTVSDVNEPTDSTTPDTAFRWSASDQQWIFNLSSKSLVKGKTYQGTIRLIDGSAIMFRFGLR